MVEIVISEDLDVSRFLDEFRHRILRWLSANNHRQISRIANGRTLDMSLKTDACASLKRATTSCKLLSMESSSPTARVIRPARLLRRLWSMFSSHGEPGARKAL